MEYGLRRPCVVPIAFFVIDDQDKLLEAFKTIEAARAFVNQHNEIKCDILGACLDDFTKGYDAESDRFYVKIPNMHDLKEDLIAEEKLLNIFDISYF